MNTYIEGKETVLVSDIKKIIENGRQQAYAAINSAMITTYWNIGRRIVEEEQHGEKRAEYGQFLAHKVADALAVDYGNTFSYRNICYFRQFYLCFNDIEIVNARVHNLTWTHIRHLLRVTDEKARLWYMKEASILKGNEQLFAAKYKTYLPTEEQLRTEIERQKEIFRLQHETKEN